MRTDERFDDDGDAGDPAWASPYIDGAWGRTANPNTVDGELQNLAAFGSGSRPAHRAGGAPPRTWSSGSS